MATPGPARTDEDEGPTPNAVITVTGGTPAPLKVEITLHGTVQFVNADPIDYKVRLRADEKDPGEPHPIVDVLLPARGSFTLIVDPHTIVDDECHYELFPTDVFEFVNRVRATSFINEDGRECPAQEVRSASVNGGSSGGGTIKVG